LRSAQAKVSEILSPKQARHGVYTCHLSYSGGKERRIMVLGQPEQKYETLRENQTGLFCMSVSWLAETYATNICVSNSLGTIKQKLQAAPHALSLSKIKILNNFNNN
jgi:hypothetical protein